MNYIIRFATNVRIDTMENGCREVRTASGDPCPPRFKLIDG